MGVTGPRRFVAVAGGRYVTARALTRAVPDCEAVAAVLAKRHDFSTRVLADLPRGELLDEVDVELAEGSLAGGSLILMWTGHGVRGPDGSVRLIGHTRDRDVEVATAGRLAEWATRTGARQIFVLLDVCYSGDGLPDAIGSAHAVLEQRADVSKDWFGIFAACRPDEPALSGALAGEVVRLLESGPSTEELRRAWMTAGPDIGADALFTALSREWSQPRQTPQPAQIGTSGPMLRNPLLPPDWVEGVVEHLLVAARGTSTGANFFVGRSDPLAAVVGRLATGEPGVLLITGPPASGKSALLGRVVSLSDPAQRAAILAVDRPPPALDPGEDSIDAHLHVRSMRVEEATHQLCLRLRVPDDGVYELLALARRRRRAGRPLVLAVDGLDEAGPLDAPKLARELLVPLAQEAVVVVASRRHIGVEDAEALLGQPGRPALPVDLGTDPAATLADVRTYVERRLEGLVATMEPAVVAEEIVRIARGREAAHDGPFLLARLLTSQLRESPVDTTTERWRDQLARSVEAAIEHDLVHTVLTVAGRPQPTAARELLTALALAYGDGFPAEDGLWPAVATALSPTGTTYGQAEVTALLGEFGRHIVVGRERDVTVFRIAHQRLVDHLRTERGAGQPDWLEPQVAQAVATAVYDTWTAMLDAGARPTEHPYLWFHAWRHLADAGRPGLELLRGLVDRDTDAFLPDLALGLDRAGDRALADGAVDAAVEYQAEEVQIRRELEPAGGLELAVALFDLAMVLATAGDSEEANRIADEGTRMAWQFADEPDGALAVSVLLMARAIARRNVGDFDSAFRFATEAATFLEREVERAPVLYLSLSAAHTVGAECLMMMGRLDEATEAAEEATAAAERAEDPYLALLDALAVQTRVELAVWAAWKQAGGVDPPEPSMAEPSMSGPSMSGPSMSGPSMSGPSMSAADRLLDLLDASEPRGTVVELAAADGLRFVAASRYMARHGTGAPTDDIEELLDRAVALTRHHAEGSALAATVFAGVVLLRADLAAGDVAGDVAEAEAALELFAPENTMAAMLLGQVAWRRAQDQSLSTHDRLDGALRAADLMSGVHTQQVQLIRIAALAVASRLAMEIGDNARAIVALELATDALESSLPPPANRDFLIGAILVDRAALLIAGRVHEGLALARRAVVLLAAGPGGEATAPIRAQAQLNIATAAGIVGYTDEAAAALQSVLDELVGDERPVSRMFRGLALGAMVEVRLAAGTVDDDVALDARTSVGLLDDDLGLALNRPARPLAELRLARVLYLTGHRAESRAVTRAAAPGFAALLDGEGGLDALHLAIGMAPRGAPIPDELLDELGLDPAVLTDLRLVQPSEPGRDDVGVTNLVAALAAAEADTGRRNILRDVARERRRADPDRFDRLWTERSGQPVPPWLTVAAEPGHLVLAWAGADTWDESRAMLAQHPELLDPSTEIHLDELFGDAPDVVETHLEILAAARAGDAGPVYERLTAERFVLYWAAADDPINFLVEYEEAVTLPALAEVVARMDMPVEQAVVALFAGSERALAIRIGSERVPWPDLLGAALAADDDDRLAALATLCLWSERSGEDEQATATIALAVAWARSGRADEAAEYLRAATASPSAVATWKEVVGDAIGRDVADAAALAPLLAVLRADR